MVPPPKPRSKIVCGCYAVTEAEIVAAIRGEGLRTVAEVTACTDAGGGCSSCHPAIREYLARERERSGGRVPAAA